MGVVCTNKAIVTATQEAGSTSLSGSMKREHSREWYLPSRPHTPVYEFFKEYKVSVTGGGKDRPFASAIMAPSANILR